MKTSNAKPEGCTCRFPEIVARNGHGHDPSCPIAQAWDQYPQYPESPDRPIAKTGAELIAEERQRQIEQEGFTPEHDDSAYHKHELERMADCYEHSGMGGQANEGYCRGQWWFWGLKPGLWKPMDRIRNLVRAGALYQAAYDQCNRRREYHRLPILKSHVAYVAEELDVMQAHDLAYLAWVDNGVKSDMRTLDDDLEPGVDQATEGGDAK